MLSLLRRPSIALQDCRHRLNTHAYTQSHTSRITHNACHTRVRARTAHDAQKVCKNGGGKILDKENIEEIHDLSTIRTVSVFLWARRRRAYPFSLSPLSASHHGYVATSVLAPCRPPSPCSMVKSFALCLHRSMFFLWG
jgi:hypothetical protein